MSRIKKGYVVASTLIEKHRRLYLDNLGVQPFYRRKQVALSAASFLNFDEDAVADGIPLPVASPDCLAPVVVPDVKSDVSKAVEQVISNTSMEKEASAEQENIVETPEISSVYSLSDRPEFQMWCLLFDDVLFIDSVPLHLSVQDQTVNKRLLINITRALALKSVKPTVFDQLKWPQFPNPKLRQSGFDASEYLAQKLAILKSQHSVRQIILLGQEATWFYAALEHFDDVKTVQNVPAVATYCLSEMVRMPQLKTDVWREIKRIAR